MWPDGPNGNCCLEHDVVYHKGGTAKARLEADIRLMQCVANNSGTFWARLMFIGVCIGGMPIFPFPWRWGYGRKYKDSIRYDKE